MSSCFECLYDVRVFYSILLMGVVLVVLNFQAVPAPPPDQQKLTRRNNRSLDLLLLRGNNNNDSYGWSLSHTNKAADDDNTVLKLQQQEAKIAELQQELQEMREKIAAAAEQPDVRNCTKTTQSAPPQQQQRQSSSSPFSSFSSPVCHSWHDLLLSSTPLFNNNFQQSSLPSATSLWNAHLPTILQSSRHQNDPKYLLRDFTAELLQLVSNRLVNSVKSVPRTTQQWRAVEHALQILHDRVQYLKQTKNQQDSTIQEPRKLRIAIMGGSLLVGVNCRKVLPEMGVKGILMPNRLCTWSSRLQQFMNHLFGNNDVVTVDKIAIGGTNSDTGQTILNYQLMPHTNYDVLINAYSTNDMHYTTIQEAESNQQTLEERVFDIVQEYVRTALQSRPIQQQEKKSTCMSRPPLLLHMDDYLGNEQRQILETTAISKAANLLSSYYGFASMSYADMIRDLVYGNTRERWLSPNGWYENESTTMMREIHPSMAMHMASTWVTVFNLLNLALNYCSMHHGTNHHGGGAPILYQDSVGGMPNITHATNIPKGKPPYPPHGLPPPLTKDLSLEDVSELWRQSSKSASTTTFEDLPTCTEEQMESQSTKRCLFAWVADLSQQQNNETWIKEIFDARTVENTGWKLQNDHNKRGYVPSSVNARLVLRFETVTQPIQVVTLFYMRSYGDDWDYSRMQLSLFQRADQMKEWETISQNELLGGHEKNTSETYTFDLPLSVPVGSDLQISLEFKNGTKFKVQGLAVCS